MSAKRKKWRLKLVPIFAYSAMPSRAGAYRAVAELRERYALGVSRVHHVEVQVDEGEGQGWQAYERFIFPPPKEST